MESLSVYTDGSCNMRYGIGAWAAIIVRNDTKTVLTGISQQTTHHRMEVQAVISALTYIRMTGFPATQPVLVITDSQYVAGLPERQDKLTRTGFGTKKGSILPNAALLKTLFRLFGELDISIIKVKSHRRSSPAEILNREADILCRRLLRDQIGKIAVR